MHCIHRLLPTILYYPLFLTSSVLTQLSHLTLPFSPLVSSHLLSPLILSHIIPSHPIPSHLISSLLSSSYTVSAAVSISHHSACVPAHPALHLRLPGEALWRHEARKWNTELYHDQIFLLSSTYILSVKCFSFMRCSLLSSFYSLSPSSLPILFNV